MRSEDELREFDKLLDTEFAVAILPLADVSSAVTALLIAAEHIAHEVGPDEAKFGLQHALAQIGSPRICKSPTQVTEADVRAAASSIHAGRTYQNAICTMIQAFNGDLDVTVKGSDLRITGPPAYCVYEILDLAIDLEHQESQYLERSTAGICDALAVPLSRALLKDSDTLHIPRLAKYLRALHAAIGEGATVIPDDWFWCGLHGADVRRVIAALNTFAVERELLVLQATERLSLPHPPLRSCLELITMDELASLLAQVTDLQSPRVVEILKPLVYGTGTDRPDPALQPLFATNGDQLVMPLKLVSSSRVQRNYLKLAGRIDKQAFDASSSVFSDAMVSRLKAAFAQLPGVVVHSGVSIPSADHLGDLDLVVFAPTERTCLIVELKWSLDAAETREIVRQRETVLAGRVRVGQRLEYLRANCTEFVRDAGLSTDLPWLFEGLVVHAQMSLGSRGGVPIVADHLLRMALAERRSLKRTIAWCVGETFLPQHGVDFMITPQDASLGSASFQWARMAIDFEAVRQRVKDSLRDC